MQFLEPPVALPQGVKVVFTTRFGGVSQGPYASLNLATHVEDSPGDVFANRRYWQMP